jgi:ribokinase
MKDNLKVAIIGLSGKSIFLKVDEFHKSGETIQAIDSFIEPGGKGYNQASCLLKLGANVSYLTTVGQDEYARTCYDYLNQTNSKLYFKEIEGKKTALACILRNKAGENQVTVYPGASSDLNLNHLKEFENEIKNADILLLTLEPTMEVVEEAIRLAKKNNVLVILNPAPYKENFKLYNLCDIIIPNEIEAKQIFGLHEDVDIEVEIKKIVNSHYYQNNFKNLIITLGSKGLLVVEDKIVRKINAIKVKAVDTTGAGDVFNASFVYFYGNGKSIKEACNYANIAAAISTTKDYVINSLPALTDILTFKKI